MKIIITALPYSALLCSALPCPSQSHHRVLICSCADAALPYRPRIVDMPLRRDSRREVAEGIGFRLLSEKNTPYASDDGCRVRVRGR